MGTVTAHEATNRVQVAAHHWRPRFVANGIDVNDFDETVARTTEWKDWAPNWKAVGEMHEALGVDAEKRGRWVSAAQAYQRAAWSWHLGKFLWFEDAGCTESCATGRSPSTARRCLTSILPRSAWRLRSKAASSLATCGGRQVPPNRHLCC